MVTADLRPLTVSAIEAYRTCPTKYQLRYDLGWSQAGYNSALSVGDGMHVGGANLRVAQPLPVALVAAGQAINKRWQRAIATTTDANALRVQVEADTRRVGAMLMGYYYRWHERHEAIFTSRNEQIVTAPLVNPATDRESRTFYLRGILDAVIHAPDHAPGAYAYEMKTTSESLDEAEGWLRHSIQIPLYQYLLSRWHYTAKLGEVLGTVVDIVKKPVLRKRNTGKNAETHQQYAERCVAEYRENPDRYFRRVTLDYDEARVREALRIAWRTAEAIRQSDRHGYLKIPGPGCKGPYGWCRFRALCWYGDLEGYEHGTDDRYDAEQGK